MLELLQTDDDIRAFEPDWRGLEAAAAAPLLFQSPDWVIPWVAAFAAPGAVRLALLRESGTLRAVAPLLLTSTRLGPFPTRALTFPRNDHSTRGSILCAAGDEVAAPDLLLALVEAPGSWDVLELRDLPARSPVVDALAHRLAARGVVAEWLPSHMRTPVLERHGAWQEYVETRSRNFRRNLRRAEAKLERFGDVQIACCRSAQEIARGVATLGAIERAGWKGAAGTAIGGDERLMRFYAEVAERFAARGALDLSVLTLGRQPAAACLAVRVAGVVYGLKVSYDPAFAEGSPGLYLALAMFERQWTPDTIAFDLLEESGFPADRLTDRFDDRVILRIFPRRPYGRLLGTLKLGLRRSRRPRTGACA